MLNEDELIEDPYEDIVSIIICIFLFYLECIVLRYIVYGY